MGVRSAIRTRHVDFAQNFALDTSILTALSKAIPHGTATVFSSFLNSGCLERRKLTTIPTVSTPPSPEIPNKSQKPRGPGDRKDSFSPDPPILAFFDFLAFFVCRFSLLFRCVFPFFSKDFRISAKRKTLAFFRGFPSFFPEKQGLEGQGRSNA